MCKVYIHRFSHKKQSILKDGGIIMKRKAVALILIVQILALSLFTGCGKEKLTQDPGTMSSEMTGDQIEFIKNFELDATDISKHFTNLIVNTPDGSYDLLKEPMSVLSNKDTYIMNPEDRVWEENDIYTFSQITQAYNLGEHTGVNAADFYLNGEKDNLVFSYFNVQYFNFGDVSKITEDDVSVMGITNKTDLKTIQKLFGEPHKVHGEQEMWTTYQYIISMNGMPMEVNIQWDNENDVIDRLDIFSYFQRYRFYLEKEDLSDLEAFYKNK